MTQIVFGQDQRVGKFVAEGLYGIDGVEDFGKFVTIGIARDNKLLAGAVFNNTRVHNGIPFDMNISFYAKNPAWATRSNMVAILTYPFDQMKLKRITAVVRKSNTKVKKLISTLGFQYEGKARLAWDGANDAYIYGMIKEDADMCLTSLKENHDG